MPKVDASTQTTNHGQSILQVEILFQHDTYYLPGGDLFIRIDDTIFQIHAYFLTRESTIWRHVVETNRRGRTVNDPIKLGIHIPCAPPPTIDIFAHFLWVFYNPTYYNYTATRETWSEIYILALKWEFKEIQLARNHEIGPTRNGRNI